MRFVLVTTCDFLARIAKPKGETTLFNQSRAAAATISSSHLRAASRSRFTFPISEIIVFRFGEAYPRFNACSPLLSETDGTANSKFGGRAFNLVQLFDRLGKILAVLHRIFSQLT